MGTPLMFGDKQKEQLRALALHAAKNPVSMPELVERIKIPEEKRKHMMQMDSQSIEIPFGFLVTFSFETGHPDGKNARYMSMSSPHPDRLPTPEAVWMIAQELGFKNGLSSCVVWREKLQGHGEAINLVQFIETTI